MARPASDMPVHCMSPARRIATIGFGNKPAELFTALLRDARVVTVIDTRRRPDALSSGYARQRDLPFLLRSAVDIGYEHRPELAPPVALLDRYGRDEDWPAYERDFDRLVLDSSDAQQVMMNLLARSATELMALMCLESTPHQCHRRLVADRMRELDPSLEVIHLA
jgi:uncharacterized protein (DUF488 family)